MKQPYDPKARKHTPILSLALGGLQTLKDGAADSDIYENSKPRKQADRMLQYIEGSDYKYLADWEKSRKQYIEDLWKEVEKLESTEQLGYLPPGENEVFKEEAINALKRIIYLNENYETFSKIRDRELSNAARLN